MGNPFETTSNRMNSMLDKSIFISSFVHIVNLFYPLRIHKGKATYFQTMTSASELEKYFISFTIWNNKVHEFLKGFPGGKQFFTKPKKK